MRHRNGIVVALIAVVALCFASCAAGGGGSSECGNRICEEGEDAWSCPTDCAPAVCGDGLCTAGENAATCGQDCYCGNNTCDTGEDISTCVLDCSGPVCGDGTCNGTETLATCPVDCTTNPTCGDGTCNGTETSATCPVDCPASTCGDGTCNGTETPATCPADCPNPICGDGTCDAPLEDSSNCPADCGTSCSDPICDLWPQCGCAGSQKCSIDSADNRACLTGGSTSQGQPCTTDAECAAGTMCVGSDTSDLRCHQFCSTNADCPGTGGGGVCVISLVDSAQQTIVGADMCTSDCNPASTSATGCPSGWACHLQYVDENNDDIADFFLTDCANDAGTGTGVGQCDNVTNFCAPGYFCYTTWGDCIRTCRVGGSDCPGGLFCSGYTDAAIVGSIEYGYCE